MDKLQRPGISLRAIAPNAVTAMALCTGLSGAWFAMQGRWEAAIAAIVGAGILDGMDGRIARMLKGESKFGAELDSLSDVTAFGVTPALVTYMWALQHMPRFGWSITVFLRCAWPCVSRDSMRGLTCRISHINRLASIPACLRRRVQGSPCSR